MAKKTKNINGTRSIEQEVRTDSQARNLLGVSSTNYANSKVSKKPILPFLKQKKRRVYTEKELTIPKLNKSIDPEGIKKFRGKKGKVFADEESMLRILNMVTEAQDSRNASKLEKARQLEEIREAKRREMDKKEQEKEDKIRRKKSELKKKKNNHKKVEDDEVIQDKSSPKKRKKVSFA